MEANTFFDAKELILKPILSLMPKKVFKERHPGSLESPKQIQAFKARAKLAGRYRRPAQTVARLKP
ncbi:MAG: hypothetical protein J0M22_16930 [Gammaproteobacteria bacterium]|nr:hypothetical protein [Gammaproteobacteria bacterium]